MIVKEILNATIGANKTITVVQTAGVATASCADHGFVAGDMVFISGANESGYNGIKTVLSAPTTGTFTFAVASNTATPATGTVIANKITSTTRAVQAISNLCARGRDGYLGIVQMAVTGTITASLQGRLSSNQAWYDISTATNASVNPTAVNILPELQWNITALAAAATIVMSVAVPSK